MLHINEIDKTWSLFLDRDGVINYEKHMDYIHTWDEFRFYEGAKESFKVFAERFNKIFIVTNQKGVGKGLTKLEDLETIHHNMKQEITDAGGRVDAIYFCPDLSQDSPDRKPNPGMGLRALSEFPEVIPSKCIMVGNTLSDMEFGRNLGVHTVFLPTTHPEVTHTDNRIDLVCKSLEEFAKLLQNK